MLRFDDENYWRYAVNGFLIVLLSPLFLTAFIVQALLWPFAALGEFFD